MKKYTHTHTRWDMRTSNKPGHLGERTRTLTFRSDFLPWCVYLTRSPFLYRSHSHETLFFSSQRISILVFVYVLFWLQSSNNQLKKVRASKFRHRLKSYFNHQIVQIFCCVRLSVRGGEGEEHTEHAVRFQPFRESALQLHGIALHFHSICFYFVGIFMRFHFTACSSLTAIIILHLILLFEHSFILASSISRSLPLCACACFFIFVSKEVIHRERRLHHAPLCQEATRIHIVKLCKLDWIWSAITLKRARAHARERPNTCTATERERERERISFPFFHVCAFMCAYWNEQSEPFFLLCLCTHTPTHICTVAHALSIWLLLPLLLCYYWCV